MQLVLKALVTVKTARRTGKPVASGSSRIRFSRRQCVVKVDFFIESGSPDRGAEPDCGQPVLL
jgi:hypothetical protein